MRYRGCLRKQFPIVRVRLKGEPVMPGFPPSHAFHVTHLAIVYDDGITAKIRLFSQQRLAITTEGEDDGSTRDI